VDFTEFEGRVCDVLVEIHGVCEANPAAREQPLPQDLRGLLSFLRTAASELILCSSVNEAINRLKQDQLALAAIDCVANWKLSPDETKSAIRLAFANRTADTPDLPLMPFCSYLIELCNGIEPGKGPHKT
jgi:hypothetical protein